MTTPHDAGRRRLVAGGVIGAGMLALAGIVNWRATAQADDVRSTGPRPAGPVTIVAFADTGRRIGERTVPPTIKTQAEWRKQLSPAAFHVLREAGTERAYSGAYNKPKKPGFYRCVACDTALYDAATQYHSGTGWPSFWQPIANENISKHSDSTFGMTRTAISCKRCESHLGHVFHDGPQPTGLRYCMNSVALKFVATGVA